MFVEYDKVKTRFRNEGWQTMCVALYPNLDGLCVLKFKHLGNVNAFQILTLQESVSLKVNTSYAIRSGVSSILTLTTKLTFIGQQHN
jgi:hypothetical protein